MIIDQPCVSCGIRLEKGVKVVAVVDIIKGMLSIIIGSAFLTTYLIQPITPGIKLKKRYIKTNKSGGNEELNQNHEHDFNFLYTTEVVKEKVDFWYNEYDGFWISCAAIVLSIIEIILAIVLFYSVKKKSVPILHIWLIITGLLMPVNIFLLKIYEMIVVFAYTEELTCEAGGKALEEFRKLPYMCHIKTQLYPSPVDGPDSPKQTNSISKNGNTNYKRQTIYFSEKRFLMNVNTSVFSVVHHQF